MTKAEFTARLKKRLSCLGEDDVLSSASYFDEIISDRVEGGMTEEEAVNALGSPEAAAEKILADTPMLKLTAKQLQPKRRMQIWEILLLVAGAPLWVPFLVLYTVVAGIFYILPWIFTVVLYAVDAALAAGAVFSVAEAAKYASAGAVPSVVFFAGVSIALLGLCVLAFFGINQLSRFVVKKGALCWRRYKSSIGRKKSEESK